MRTLSKERSWRLARMCLSLLVPALRPSKGIKTLIHSGLKKPELLARGSVNPKDYSSADLYRRDAQCVDLLRKFVDLPSGIDTKAVALKGFSENEGWCKEINNALLDALDGSCPVATYRLQPLFEAADLVKQILGRAPSLDEVMRNAEFGPGATSQCKSNSPKSKKYSRENVHATSRLVEALGRNYSRWGPAQPYLSRFGVANVVIREHDRITTVKKTSTTDRPIGVPVHLNVFAQRGVGKLIRRRLDSFIGLPITETPEYHALLAQAAYDDGYSTIDLKSASDTVTFMIVRLLLPDDWFRLLLLCRVDNYELNGEVHSYEKFSAMGNGYTFELETLIFYALAVTASAQSLGKSADEVKHYVSTFGDDIIVKRECGKRTIELLNDAGFIVNVDKTFLDGDFFESCGSDYFKGTPVRSVFQKQLRTPQDVIQLYNNIITLSQRDSDGWHRCARYKNAAQLVLSVLKHEFTYDFSKCRVPSGYTHGLVSSFDEALPVLPGKKRAQLRSQGWQGWQHYYCHFRAYSVSSVNSEDALSRWIYERSNVDTGVSEDYSVTEPLIVSEESIRRRGIYHVARTVSFTWDGPGPWL